MEKAIIIGSLKDLTYQEINENEPPLKDSNYTVEYIQQVKAFTLWKLLKEVLAKACVLQQEEKVGKKNLWVYVKRLNYDTGEKEIIIREHYKLLESLGEGEFSETYLVRDIDLPDNHKCVIKRLKSETPELTKRFENEAQGLYKLGKYDKIPQLLARFQKDGYFYLVYEYIIGNTLKEELKGECWQESQVIVLIKEMLAILVFLQEKKIIHRDINPDNIIRRKLDNKFILTNFWFVKEVNLDSDTKTFKPMNPYMSIEVIRGRPNFSSDIYALGILAIQAFTGKNPNEFTIDPNTLNIIWRNQAKVSSQLADFIDKIVCNYVPDRYPSAAEALQALQKLDHSLL
ncbi:MAG: serine/threonine protein kinase [Moorea sp. SIO2B7]|nr:serine/threonine protein kinase [Moorena sp. SIO2B7]